MPDRTCRGPAAPPSRPDDPSCATNRAGDTYSFGWSRSRQVDEHVEQFQRVFAAFRTRFAAISVALSSHSDAESKRHAPGGEMPDTEHWTGHPGTPSGLPELLERMHAAMRDLETAYAVIVSSRGHLDQQALRPSDTASDIESENRWLRSALADRQAELSDAENRIRQVHADALALRDAELRLERMRQSLSWRVTEPLRIIDGLLRGEPARRQVLVERLLPHRFRRSGVKATAGSALHLEATETRLANRIREESVSIIVCVHNALPDVHRCLHSVLTSTLPAFELILIDDGSDEETRQFLRAFALKHDAILIRNQSAQGYTLAANKGLARAKMPWMVLLNSDTVVSVGWLDAMVAAAVQHQRIGLVGPVSNTASWQSVPFVEVDGDWAQNPLPPGIQTSDMADLVALASRRQAIDLPFLNGFCLMIRRAVLDELGPFDDKAFAAGFGEENDYCIRARQAGWRLVVADDAYVYHAQSRSYSHERRLALAKKADDALAQKWGRREIGPAVEDCRAHLALTGSRHRLLSLLAHRNASRANGRRFEGKRLAFALPSGGAAGGTNVVLQELSALEKAGADVWIVNLASNRTGFEQAYPGLGVPCVYVRDATEARLVLGGSRPSFDAVIATLYSTIDWLPRRSSIRYGYYIQDFEPWFFSTDDTEHELARLSYLRRPDAVLLTKTHWTCSKVAELAARRPVVVGPSVDTLQFVPPNRAPRGPEATLSIVAMVRVDMNRQRRAPGLTVRVLRRLATRFDKRISIAIFGSTPPELHGADIATAGLRNLGVLRRAQCAELLREADVFCDFSEWQAMGLTALEAMACGCATIVPNLGGATDFAIDGVNALVVDTADEQACFDAALRLIDDHALRQRLQVQAIADATAHEPWRAAQALMGALFPATEQTGRGAHD